MTYTFVFEAEPFRGYSNPKSYGGAPAISGDGAEEYFLGKVVRGVSRATSKAVSSIDRAAQKIGQTPIGKIAATVGRLSPYGLIGDVAVTAGRGLLRGEKLGTILKKAANAGISNVRERLRYAQMVASFVPGIGTGVAAALGAANALAEGRPITDAVIAAARGAIPGGLIAQAAFDTALNLARGKKLSEAFLAAARDKLPGGPAAKAAFDAAVAIAEGKRLQEAAFKVAGRALPASPFANDALAFVRSVAAGQNFQAAALSAAGRSVLRRMNRT